LEGVVEDKCENSDTVVCNELNPSQENCDDERRIIREENWQDCIVKVCLKGV